MPKAMAMDSEHVYAKDPDSGDVVPVKLSEILWGTPEARPGTTVFTWKDGFHAWLIPSGFRTAVRKLEKKLNLIVSWRHHLFMNLDRVNWGRTFPLDYPERSDFHNISSVNDEFVDVAFTGIPEKMYMSRIWYTDNEEDRTAIYSALKRAAPRSGPWTLNDNEKARKTLDPESIWAVGISNRHLNIMTDVSGSLVERYRRSDLESPSGKELVRILEKRFPVRIREMLSSSEDPFRIWHVDPEKCWIPERGLSWNEPMVLCFGSPDDTVRNSSQLHILEDHSATVIAGQDLLRVNPGFFLNGSTLTSWNDILVVSQNPAAEGDLHIHMIYGTFLYNISINGGLRRYLERDSESPDGRFFHAVNHRGADIWINKDTVNRDLLKVRFKYEPAGGRPYYKIMSIYGHGDDMISEPECERLKKACMNRPQFSSI